MNNKFLYAEKISLENILKVFFPTDELKQYGFIKNSLITHFKITDSIGECNFKDYFITNINNGDVFTFFSNNIGKLMFGFEYNSELQKFNVGISFDNTLITNEEIFEKLSKELLEPDFSSIFEENCESFGENAEFMGILYWLKNIASEEYEKNVIFFPELIKIQNLIIEAYEFLG